MHRLGAEVAAQVQVLDRQLVAEHHRKVHRHVGHAVADGFAEGQLGIGFFLQALVDREVFEHHDAVEQRLTTEVRPALHIGQRRLGVITNVEVVGLHFAQPVGQALIGLWGLNDRQGVDEQAEHVADVRQTFRAPRHGGAEGHRLLASVALQQQQPRALDQRVGGDAQIAAELQQARGLRLVPIRIERIVTGNVGTVARVHRLTQRGRFVDHRQTRFPEQLLGILILRLQPGNEVAIAAVFASHLARGVVLQDLAEQPRTAPAVHQDVVAGPDHLVLLIAQLQQGHPLQTRLGQVEAQRAIGAGELGNRRLAAVLLTPIEHLHLQRRMAMHHLQRFGQAVLPMETGAQDRLTHNDEFPGPAETLNVEALDRQADLLHVKAAAVIRQGVEEHAFLHRRQRIDVFDQLRRYRQGIELRLIQLRQRVAAGAGGVRVCQRNHCGQFLHRLLLEQVFGREANALLPRAADQLNRDDRITAEGEEIVGHADLLDLQNVLPDLGQLLLQRRRWRDVIALCLAGIRCRQGLAIEFAVGCQRQLFEEQPLRRHHVVRQMRLERGLQRSAQRVQLRGALIGLGRDHISQQLLAANAVDRQHHAFAHAGLGQQTRFDFTQFNTEATHLDLMVDAADVFDTAVVHETRQVAGAVHTLAVARQRVGHETFGSQARAQQIATGDAIAGQIQLRSDADWGCLQLPVEQVRSGIA